jgi:hypothetical protein
VLAALKMYVSKRWGIVTAAMLVSAALVAVPGTAGTGTRAQSAIAFRLADNSAACRWYADGSIGCRAAAAGPALVLGQDGEVQIGTRRVRWTAVTPVLGAGQTARRGAIACRAAEALVCSTANGGRVEAGPAGMGALAPPVSGPQP